MPTPVTLATKGGMKHAAVSVGVAAVLLTAGAINSNTNLARYGGDRKNITVFNNGTVTVYLGSSSGVTTANGFPLPAGSQVGFDLGSAVTLYAISGSAAQDVRVMELY